jgi:hypothetical protein
MSAASIMAMPVREAYPSDVLKAKDLSSKEKHLYMVLAAHVNHPKKNQPDQRPYDGMVFLKRPTMCEETGFSDSSAHRTINNLVKKNRICLPEGDAGGRGRPLKIHLHPDGCPCDLPKVSLKRGKPTPPKKAESVSNCHSLSASESVSNSREFPLKCVKFDDAYKEVTLSTKRTLSTPAEQAIAPKTSETLVSASTPLCGEKFSQASNQKNSSSSTTAVETITNHPTPHDPPAPLPLSALPEAVKSCAARIYGNHPLQRRDISLAKVERRITEILRYRKLTGEPAQAYLGVLADRHGGWCRYGEWKKENGRFAKGLNRWLAPGEELYEIDSPEQAIPASPEPRGLQEWEIK